MEGVDKVSEKDEVERDCCLHRWRRKKKANRRVPKREKRKGDRATEDDTVSEKRRDTEGWQENREGLSRSEFWWGMKVVGQRGAS